MTIKERVANTINWLKDERIVLSQSEFADKIGIKATQVSEMLSGKRTISDKTIHKIVGAFPIINYDWLLTGEGEMLKSNTPSLREEPNKEERLLSIIDSQQRTIEHLSETINRLTKN